MLINDITGRPLKLAEIIGASHTIFKNNITSLLFIVILIFFPINIFLSIIDNFVIKTLSGLNVDAVLSNAELFDQFINSAQYAQAMNYSFLSGIAKFLFYPLGIMAVVKIAYDYCYDNKLRYTDAIKDSLSKGVYMLLTSLMLSALYVAAILLSYLVTLLFGTPGMFIFAFLVVIIGIACNFYIYAVILRDKYLSHALKYSYSIVKGRMGKAILRMVAIFFMNIGIEVLISNLFAWAPNNFMFNVVINTIGSVVSVYFYIVNAVWFLNWEADMVKT